MLPDGATPKVVAYAGLAGAGLLAAVAFSSPGLAAMAAPFALLLPHANLFWTTALTIVIGLVFSSAFSAILVYAQELMPGQVGMVSGLFFGFAFGMGGLGAAALGLLADHTSIDFVYRAIAYLPLLGIVAALLPKGRGR